MWKNHIHFCKGFLTLPLCSFFEEKNGGPNKIKIHDKVKKLRWVFIIFLVQRKVPISSSSSTLFGEKLPKLDLLLGTSYLFIFDNHHENRWRFQNCLSLLVRWWCAENFQWTDVAADKTLRNNRSIFFYDIILLIWVLFIQSSLELPESKTNKQKEEEERRVENYFAWIWSFYRIERQFCLFKVMVFFSS